MVLEEMVGITGIYLQIARFFIILAGGVLITRAILIPIVSRLLKSSEKERLYSVRKLVGALGVFVSLIVALQAASFGGLMTVLGTVAAALTIAIGFGLREQIGNLVSGLFIQMGEPFLEGDYIYTEKAEGTVRDIKLRETRIRSPTGEKVVVPNNYLSNNPLKNLTKGSVTTDSFTVNVPMDSAHEAEELYHEVTEDDSDVLEEPSPKAYFSDISDGEVVMHFQYGVKDPENIKQVRDGLLQSFTTELLEHGIIDPEEG